MMRKSRTAFDEPRADLGRRGAARFLDWRYKALYEFLQVSPSYWAAHEFARGSQPDVRTPTDFDLVRATYDRLGSVWQTSFHDWWFNTAQFQFQRIAPPNINVVGHLDYREPLEKERVDQWNIRLHRALVEQRDIEGMPATVVLAVPLYGSAKDIQRAVADALKPYEIPLTQSGQYRLVKSKARQSAVVKCLQVVRARAAKPSEPIWALAGRINMNATRSQRGTLDDKHVLSAHMSRYTKRAYVFAENAARGSFPDETPLQGDLATQSFDFALLNRVYRQEVHSLERQIAIAKESLASKKRDRTSRSQMP